MITLNLLPPIQKIYIKQAGIYTALQNFLAIILIVAIIISFLLVGARIILQNNFYNLITHSSLSLNDTQGFDSKIRNVNEKLKVVQEIQNEFTKWSSFLIAVNDLVPENIQLNLLAINQEAKTISIEGNAKLRDDFLKFKENLQNSSLLSEIESPLSNLVKKQDIDFRITAKLNFNHDNQE